MGEQLDSAAYYHIAYDAHGIMNPLDDSRFLFLAEQCGLNANARILDIGSGNGWSSLLLCRTFGCHSVQVDVSPQWTARARALFVKEALSDHTEIHCMDAAAFHLEDASYDLIVCLGTAAVYGGFAPALEVLRPALRDGGTVIIGEPSAESPLPRRYREYLDALGWGILDARALLRAIDDSGFEALMVLRSSGDEWDRYMGMQWKAISDRLRSAPGDAQLREFAEWARDEQESYLRFQRHWVDWNVFLLRTLI
ncbi:MAG: class I SAM-dependent methyltransferase [Bacteroidota bacterium]|nr:class I SAM-dependent methyltransferase [Bacteroidota bacterium]